MAEQIEYREGLDELADDYRHILELLGEDPEREGLQKTPMRVAKAMQFLTQGYTQDAHEVLRQALFREDYSQMVIVKDIDFFSLCEHHMLPFYGKAHVICKRHVVASLQQLVPVKESPQGIPLILV